MDLETSKCAQCGAALSAADLARPACSYCGAALPHQVAAAQKAAVVREILADRDGDGVPDVFQSMGSAGGSAATSGVSVVAIPSPDGARPAVVMHRSTAGVVTSFSVDISSPAPRRSPGAVIAVVVVAGVLLALAAAVLLLVSR